MDMGVDVVDGENEEDDDQDENEEDDDQDENDEDDGKDKDEDSIDDDIGNENVTGVIQVVLLIVINHRKQMSTVSSVCFMYFAVMRMRTTGDPINNQCNGRTVCHSRRGCSHHHGHGDATPTRPWHSIVAEVSSGSIEKPDRYIVVQS